MGFLLVCIFHQPGQKYKHGLPASDNTIPACNISTTLTRDYRAFLKNAADHACQRQK
jgi:hypothetical protein